MKKFLAMALALLMVAVLLPVTAMAETTTVNSPEDLKTALKNSATSITLGADIDLTGTGGSEQVNVLHDTTIDLNGHTLNGSIWSGNYLCTADGTRLTLVDSAGNGQIYSKFRFGDDRAMMQANAVTAWQHAVTINGGTYQSNNVAIVCQVQNTNAAEGVIINGGTFKGSKDLSVESPVPAGGCVEAVIGTVTINGGTFEAAQYGSVIIAESGDSNCDTVVNIYGGTFSGACMFDFGEDHSSKSIVNVYGGDFTVKSPDGSELKATQFAYDNYTHAALVNNDMFELNIMGGTFNINPAKYVAAGCPVTKNADGKYVVGAKNANHVNTAVANTEVSIGKESMTETGATETTLQVNETTSVTFDNAAMGTISNQAGNADYVTLEVKVGVEAPQDVKTAYETATKDTNANCVFTVDLVGITGGAETKLFTAPDDGTTIGTATVRFQYEKNAKDVKCYYLSGGSMVEINGDNLTYDSSTGMVTVKLNHFSTYVVTGNTSTGAGSITIIVPDDTTDTTTTTETTKNPTTGMNDFVGAAVALAVISVIGAAAVVRKK